MIASSAAWISPLGQIILVEQSHVISIITDPALFDLPADLPRQLFSECGERLGTEGRARDILIRRVVASGWIRARRYANRHWSFTTRTFDSVTLDRIRSFADYLLSRKDSSLNEFDHHMPVVIYAIDTNEQIDLQSISNLVPVAPLSGESTYPDSGQLPGPQHFAAGTVSSPKEVSMREILKTET